jgi:hypothetical protein
MEQEREGNVVTSRNILGLVGIGLSLLIIGVFVTVIGWNSFEELLMYSSLPMGAGILTLSPMLVCIGILLMLGGTYSIATSRGNMARKLMAGGTIIALVIAVVSGILVFEPFSTHYEASVHKNNTRAFFHIDEPEDGNISIGFVDDPTLLYSIDFEQHPFGPRPYMSYFGNRDWPTVVVGVICNGPVNSIDIILGTGVSYDIVVRGSNLSTIITYDNGALVGGNYYNHYASGTLLFNFTENVNVTADNMEVDFKSISGNLETDPLHIAFVIDLPDGMDGSIKLGRANYFNIVDSTGWWHRGFDIYSTAVTIESPALVIDGDHTSSVLAWLYN